MGDLKPFGELTRDEKLALFTAWVDGSKLQFKSADGYWKTANYPNWYPTVAYRVVPQKPSINWDHVDEKYNWLCVQRKGGNPQLFENKPQHIPNTWFTWADGGGVITAKGFSSLTLGNCEPEDSLVGRHDHD